ncbi:hypothetical protein GKE82_20325 [Conexibacter sp. W3-3-2]|uniref:Uncharacterized protein n=1 Tax=Paraconexibacter algicola TaxID=2133960 RepID=A0A2T4ULX4_9ACTN|nr:MULTISPECIES: hypothetical protein [Solirubrobacterales]MTD46570.1 hypothetical protein [Conexibacter sp. W3-3-2]PTL60208.1 hypothetical protein C7Y72_11455 [Paraconexibacter algicola]
MSTFETAVQQWREGQRRIDQLEDAQQIAAERVVERTVQELRRRLGSSFTTEELVDLYDRGTSWVLDLAVATAPGAPWAWEQRLVADAAFHRYVREASDYAGGRRLDLDAD